MPPAKRDGPTDDFPGRMLADGDPGMGPQFTSCPENDGLGGAEVAGSARCGAATWL